MMRVRAASTHHPAAQNVQWDVSKSATINDLLRRLSDAIVPTWATGWRWRPQPSKADYDKFIAASKDALNAVRITGDWQAIPSLLDILSHDNADIRDFGGTVVADLAAFIPVEALPGFEGRLRDSTLRAYSWNTLRVEEVVKQEWPLRVWAMFTMHPNGYVREAALRHLASAGDFKIALPYFLLRVNDWVSQVRTVATGAIKSLIDTKDAAPWVPVLGLLDQLRLRSRADHAWLLDEVTLLFLRAGSPTELRDAAGSEDPAVARWAFRAAMNLPEADRVMFIRLAIESPDPIVRLRAATAVRAWKGCPGRERLLERMAADCFMPVRRESLYAALDGTPEDRRAFLYSMLLDRHAGIRHAARFYLRDQPRQAVDPFDARTFYVDAITTAKSGVLAAAIAGLGECGHKADAESLMRYLSERRPSVAAAAVRAIASLDHEQRIAWFVELLRDDRPAVAREACRALLPRSNVAPVQALRKVLQEGCGHSRRLALRVLLRRHPYDAVADAVLAIGSGDAILARVGSEFIEWAMPWRVSYGPSEVQKTAVLSAIANLPQPLPSSLRKRLGDFMGFS